MLALPLGVYFCVPFTSRRVAIVARELRRLLAVLETSRFPFDKCGEQF